MTEPTRTQPADLLPAVLDAVAEASVAIMEVYASSHDVEYKSDESPITRADRAAHEILAARLGADRPVHPGAVGGGRSLPRPGRRAARGRSSGSWTPSMAPRSSSAATASSR